MIKSRAYSSKLNIHKIKNIHMDTAAWLISLIIVNLTDWGRVTHLSVSKLTIIDSGNDLSPGRRQAIIRTNIGILLIRTSGTNFSENLSEIHTLFIQEKALENVACEMASIFSRP